MFTKHVLLHLVFFLLLISFISCLVLYQVVVNQTNGRIPFKTFFKPSTFQAALQAVFYQKVPVQDTYLFYIKDGRLYQNNTLVTNKIEQGNQKIFVLHNATMLTTIFDRNLKVTILQTGTEINFSLPAGSDFVAQQWVQDDKLVIDGKQNDTTRGLFVADLTTQKISQLLEYSYTGSEINTTVTAENTVLAYPSCTPLCSVVLYDVIQQKIVSTIPAFTSADKQPSISDMVFDFYDPNKGIIAYHSPSQQELFVINEKLELLQKVRLENERNTVYFKGYLPATQQLVFTLQEKNNLSQFVALYAADKPSLHLIARIQPVQSVVVLPTAQALNIDTAIFTLDGKLYKNRSDHQLVIPTY